MAKRSSCSSRSSLGRGTSGAEAFCTQRRPDMSARVRWLLTGLTQAPRSNPTTGGRGGGEEGGGPRAGDAPGCSSSRRRRSAPTRPQSSSRPWPRRGAASPAARPSHPSTARIGRALISNPAQQLSWSGVRGPCGGRGGEGREGGREETESEKNHAQETDGKEKAYPKLALIPVLGEHVHRQRLDRTAASSSARGGGVKLLLGLGLELGEALLAGVALGVEFLQGIEGRGGEHTTSCMYTSSSMQAFQRDRRRGRGSGCLQLVVARLKARQVDEVHLLLCCAHVTLRGEFSEGRSLRGSEPQKFWEGGSRAFMQPAVGTF